MREKGGSHRNAKAVHTHTAACVRITRPHLYLSPSPPPVLLAVAVMAGVAASLRPGRSVRIEGLQKRADINGKRGKIVRLDGERWIGSSLTPLCCHLPSHDNFLCSCVCWCCICAQ